MHFSGIVVRSMVIWLTTGSTFKLVFHDPCHCFCYTPSIYIVAWFTFFFFFSASEWLFDWSTNKYLLCCLISYRCRLLMGPFWSLCMRRPNFGCILMMCHMVLAVDSNQLQRFPMLMIPIVTGYVYGFVILLESYSFSVCDFVSSGGLLKFRLQRIFLAIY